MAGPDTYVRLALPKDVDAVASIQARAWREAYESMLPVTVLSRLEPAARAQWGQAVLAPPTDAHHLLVAVVRGDRAGGSGGGDEVAGFAAVCPSTDPGDDPQRVGSLLVLTVDPDRHRAGHGSRLLAAAVQTLRTSRFEVATCWLPEVNDAQRNFLTSAGWAHDGARRELDTGAGGLHEVRLHTALV